MQIPVPTAARPASNPIDASLTLVQMPVRHTHRERDFGVGYGNSSGYASNRRYANDWATPRFKFA